MEKLFYVSYSYILYGYCYTWITHKEKPVEAEIHSSSFFIKSKEDKLEETLTEQPKEETKNESDDKAKGKSKKKNKKK